MEVKLFVHNSAYEAEAALKVWLIKENASIQYIGQSQSEHGGKFVFIVSVFYKKADANIADKPVKI